jgi:hypothetical protein
MKKLTKAETHLDHELRMQEWKKQDDAAIAAGKMLTLHAMPELISYPLWSWKAQAKIVMESPELFVFRFQFAENSRN